MTWAGVTLAASMMVAGQDPTSQTEVAVSPNALIASAFTKETQRYVCPAGSVLIPPLLGEIAKNFDLNPFALPPLPREARLPSLDGLPLPDSAEGRLAAWIVVSADLSQPEAVEAGLTAAQHETLTTIRWDLADYLRSIERVTEPGLYRVGAGGPIGPITSGAQRSVVARRFFAPVLGRTETPLALACTVAPPVQHAGAGGNQGEAGPPNPQPRRAVLAVRGRIDDLAAPRLNGDGAISDEFKKACDATLAFTDNGVKNEQSVAIEAAVGVGFAITPYDSLFGFLHYTQNTTETDAADDDDDAKDIRALSPGLLVRRSLLAGPIAASLGATIYPTFDFAQDSEMLRARLFLNDIAIDPGGKIICGAERRFGPLLWNCRLSVSAEWAHVFDAGRSADLATLDDDQYFGLGGQAGLTLSWPSAPLLKPFEFAVDYRYLGIASGGMNDPDRLTLGLNYKIAASNISLGVSHVRGENFETFQREELTKFSVGFRY